MPYDLGGSRKKDALIAYRSGQGMVAVIKHGKSPESFYGVYQEGGVRHYDFVEDTDIVVSYDYDHKGEADHMICVAPGQGKIRVTKCNFDYPENGPGPVPRPW